MVLLVQEQEEHLVLFASFIFLKKLYNNEFFNVEEFVVI